jgi:hypothetical protein
MVTNNIPFRSLIDASIAWSEESRIINLIRCKESISVQKWMLDQIEGELKLSDNEYVQRSMSETMQAGRMQVAECVKVYERTLALFN